MSSIQIPVTLPGFNETFTSQDLLTLPVNFPTFSVQFNAQNTLVALTNQYGITVFSPKAQEWIPPECCDGPLIPQIPVPTSNPDIPHSVVPEPHSILLIGFVLIFLFVWRSSRGPERG